MSSKKAVGVAPLVTGLLLASQSFNQSVLSYPSLSSVTGMIGSLAAIFVGIGILSGRWGFDVETDSSSQTVSTVLVVIALVAFILGFALTVA